MTVSFGYQAGDGSGVNTVLVGATLVTLSAFENTTGATLYVDTVRLLGVTSVLAANVRMAIYDFRDVGYPLNLLASTATLAALAIGSNDFAVLGDPLAVGPGQSVFVAIESTAPVHCDGAVAVDRAAVTPSGGGAAAFPSTIATTIGLFDLIVPAELRGSATGPGDLTDMRADFMSAEVVSDGYPAVRADLLDLQALTGGFSAVRCDDTCLQVLFPVVEGGEMATDELKFSPGVSWEAKKRATFNTGLEEAVNLRDVSAALAEFPRWEFEVSFPFLPDNQVDARLLTTALEYCEGFFCRQRGRHGLWLFRDPRDNQVLAGPMIRTTDSGIGGDGVCTDFWLGRDIGGQFQEPIGQVDTSGAGYRIDVAGAAVAAADFTLLAPNRISFDAAPADGATTTWTGSYFFVCRFLDDAAEFTRFAGNLWEWQQVGFRSVLQ